jgi:hypothetical protein
VAQLAMQWSSQFHENQGDVLLAQRRGLDALALADESDGPWGAALIQAQLAGLIMQVGAVDQAMGYARDAIPVLEALGADEDVAQLKAVLAIGAMEAGDLVAAERIFDEIEADDAGTGIFGAAIILLCGRPELDLAAGRTEAGLRGYREGVVTLSARSFPGLEAMLGFEPWTLYAEAAAVAAHVRHGGRDQAEGLRANLLRKVPEILDGAIGFLDYPVFGSILFALAEWELADRTSPERAAVAVRLLVLSDRFGYNRQLPSLAWAPALAMAEAALPGEVDRVRAELAARTAPELRPLVKDLLAQLG